MTRTPVPPIKLNLGCGQVRREGYLGVDRYFCQGADLLCDLARPLPFANDVIDEFFLDNVVEHIPDIPALMAELVRTGKPGARITIETPHFSALSSWRDPTHVHHLSYFSFDHFAKPEVRHYIGGGLRVANRRLSFGGGLLGLFGRFLFRLSPLKYEQKYCFIFRAGTLCFDLEIVK